MNAKTSIIHMLTMRMGYGDAEIDNFFDESDNYLNMAMAYGHILPSPSLFMCNQGNLLDRIRHDCRW